MNVFVVVYPESGCPTIFNRFGGAAMTLDQAKDNLADGQSSGYDKKRGRVWTIRTEPDESKKFNAGFNDHAIVNDWMAYAIDHEGDEVGPIAKIVEVDATLPWWKDDDE